MHFEIIGEIQDKETIAARSSIKDFACLRRQYGPGRWRKLKGVALVQLQDKTIRSAEIHWYEAHGDGRRKLKIKRFVD